MRQESLTLRWSDGPVTILQTLSVELCTCRYEKSVEKKCRQRDAGICLRRHMLLIFKKELAHADAWEDTRKAKRKMALANIFLGYHQQNSKGRKRARLQEPWRLVKLSLAPLRPQVDPSPPPLLELL